MNYPLLGLLVVSAIVGLGRLMIPGHDLSLPGSYEALAHIWVGVLLTVICCSLFARRTRWIAGAMLAAISVLEVVLFLLR